MKYATTARTKIYLYKTNHASIGSQNFTSCSKSGGHVTVKFSDFIMECPKHSK